MGADRGARAGAAYLLMLWNRRLSGVKVGGLGRREFAPGFYVYVGSGGANVLKRIQRHLRATKPARWHIDYITAGPGRMRPVDTYVLPGRAECRLARLLGRGLAVVSGFGSSDCRCPGHLFYAPDFEMLQAAIGSMLARR